MAHDRGERAIADSGGELMYFGIGAQKAATSWLGDYLNRHPQVGGNPPKAYHYFNRAFPTFDPEHVDHRPKVHPRLLPIFATREARARVSAYKRGLNRWATRYLPRSYKSLVRGSQPSCRAFGDITPAYALLTAEAYRAMAETHPRTRFFFVMRDPVDRLWSAVRMNIRKGQYGGDLTDEGLIAAVDSVRTDYENFGRSNYPQTIAELEKAVPSEDILYLFYETLFTEETIGRLTEFLGIDYLPFSSERVNSGGAVKMPMAWKRRAREVLDPVYVAINAKFGDRVPAYWNDESRYA